MTFDEYQAFTDSTAIYKKPDELAYVACGMVGEACEFAGKVLRLVEKRYSELQEVFLQETNNKKRDALLAQIDNIRRLHSVLSEASSLGNRAETLKKDIRSGKVSMPSITIPDKATGEELSKEIGDVGWYIARACRAVSKLLSEVIQQNVDKLSSRKERGVIQGNGDNR